MHNTSRLIAKGNPYNKQIAFTYDCGFEYGSTPQILNILNKHGVKATFFITGSWAEKFPQLAKRIAYEGHEVGNHSYNHPDMRKIPYFKIKESIIKTEEIIKKTININPRPLFREPYGAFNDRVLRAVGEAGYRYSIYWSIDTLDWQQPQPQVIVNRILNKVTDGDIVLMHVHGKSTAAASDAAIKILKESGYKFVTISQLLKLITRK